MIKQGVKRIFSAMGFDVHRKILVTDSSESHADAFIGYDFPKEGGEAVQIAKNNSMMIPLNLFTLFEQAAYCEHKRIPGAYVECGVWKGGAVGVMAKANLDFGRERRELHLFDAFDNICWPVAELDGAKAIEDMAKYAGKTDVNEMHGQLEPIEGAYDFIGGHGTIDACKELLEQKLKYPPEKISYHKGWFQDTVPVDAEKIAEIAILRLDGDYYHSIKVCLDYLYDKVVKGGLVVIDDYGYYDGCTKAVDEFLDLRNIKTFLSYSSPGCRYFVKP